MKSNVNKITIELFGTSIKIQSNEDPNYIHGLISLIEEKTKTITDSVNLHDPLKIAVLTTLLLADEYVTLKNNQDHTIQHTNDDSQLTMEKEVEDITSRLIQQIDKFFVELQ
jgi:cell division protein ZapA (FtsZ GTPase activity inhibitor)